MLFQELHRPAHLIGGAHILVEAAVGQFIGIEPDAGGILERSPRRLDGGARRKRAGLGVLLPFAGEHVFGAGDFEAMDSGNARPLEMHLAEDGRGVTGLAKLAGQGGLVFGERSREAGDTGHVGHLSGEQALAGRRADWRVAVVVRKTRALGSEPVELRSAGRAVAVRTQDIAGMVVGEDKEEVRPPGRAGREKRRTDGAESGAAGEWLRQGGTSRR